MIDIETVKALRSLRLPGMAQELESQLEQPQIYRSMSFEDRLGLMIDAETVSRRTNAIRRRLHDARLSESQASIEAIEYYEDRDLDRDLIMQLATCRYIQEKHHIVITGATGAGKTYIANALGAAACRKLYRVRYVRLSDLLNEYAVAKSLGTQGKMKKAYARFDLLIVDEWLLRPLTENESYDLLEIMDAYYQNGSLIICTQYTADDWYYRIDADRPDDADSASAEAIIDRIVNNKYSINLKGKESMRRRHAFDSMRGDETAQ